MLKSPLKLKPFFVPKPWGGSYLNKLIQNENNPIGEMILASGLDVFPVYAIEPETDKKFLLKEYWEKYASKIWKSLSNIPFPKEFPLLLKILSTQEPLSIQVHPSDKDLKNLLKTDGFGKMESWIILDSKKDSQIFLGIQDNIDIDSIEEWISKSNALENFYTYQPNLGDAYVIHPGTVHGTNGEILFYEIQQPSDYTYRIYDFGRGRELHLNKAKKVIRKNKVAKTTGFSSIKEEHFQLSIFDQIFEKEWKINNIFEVVTYFGPPANIIMNYSEEKRIRVFWGDSFFFWRDSSFRIFREEMSISKLDGLPLTKEKDSLLFFASV